MLRFGNFGGLPVKILWCVLGLAPTVPLGTGVPKWRNRVLSRPSGGRETASLSKIGLKKMQAALQVV
jgi:uncharacterized iron-regulated membrane protein